MKTALKVMMSVVLGLATAGAGGYCVTNWYVTDAQAQGAATAKDTPVDAGPALVIDASVSDGQKVLTTGTSTGTALAIPDPSKDPGAAYEDTKEWFLKGPFQGAVFLVLIICAFVHERTKPEDKDGDGQPDADTTWRGKTWAISGALMLIGVPGFLLLIHDGGASWNALWMSTLSAAGLLMSNLNPQKGAKAAT